MRGLGLAERRPHGLSPKPPRLEPIREVPTCQGEPDVSFFRGQREELSFLYSVLGNGRLLELGHWKQCYESPHSLRFVWKRMTADDRLFSETEKIFLFNDFSPTRVAVFSSKKISYTGISLPARKPHFGAVVAGSLALPTY